MLEEFGEEDELSKVTGATLKSTVVHPSTSKPGIVHVSNTKSLKKTTKMEDVMDEGSTKDTA